MKCYSLPNLKKGMFRVKSKFVNHMFTCKNPIFWKQLRRFWFQMQNPNLAYSIFLKSINEYFVTQTSLWAGDISRCQSVCIHSNLIHLCWLQLACLLTSRDLLNYKLMTFYPVFNFYPSKIYKFTTKHYCQIYEKPTNLN